MGGLFGGSSTNDGGAGAMAQANLEAAREAQAADQKRWEQEQATAAQLRQDQTDKDAKAAADTQAALDKAKADEAKQAAARAVTGSPVVNVSETKSDQAKFLANSMGAGLPGFSSLLQQYSGGGNLQYPDDQNQQKDGFNGQGNSLVSKFTSAPGGRKYYNY